MIRPTILAAGLLAGAAGAEVHPAPVWAFNPTHENFCPAGLQPVTLDGTICCGTPNRSASYVEVKRHPVVRRHVPAPHPVRPAAMAPLGKGID